MSDCIKVLIIDNDPTFRGVIRRLLDRYFDASVSEASDGPDGLEAVKRDGPDLVLLDVSTPRLDGLDILRRIRRIEGCKHTPVVAVSATNDDGKVVRLIQLGVTDYLLKPLNAELTRRRLQGVYEGIMRRRRELDAGGTADHVA